jgi:hypothetical protein
VFEVAADAGAAVFVRRMLTVGSASVSACRRRSTSGSGIRWGSRRWLAVIRRSP